MVALEEVTNANKQNDTLSYHQSSVIKTLTDLDLALTKSLEEN